MPFVSEFTGCVTPRDFCVTKSRGLVIKTLKNYVFCAIKFQQLEINVPNKIKQCQIDAAFIITNPQ